MKNYTTRIGLSANYNEEIFDQQIIHIVEGPQIDAFSETSINALTSSVFKISEQSDRMGYRLQGDSIPPIASADIISETCSTGKYPSAK
ncbi:allophanate hydrolase subunit 2 [Staphylococcus gallinarum]|uniref:Allophanate hydrolase subunit 2 n=1 Tax=Staphylococcus gallinarum TaxID=1293 RepID=A0A380FGK6_STAGA|nr:allophanate hydrolase subunit 2 [Staphylococcus gallinarum]